MSLFQPEMSIAQGWGWSILPTPPPCLTILGKESLTENWLSQYGKDMVFPDHISPSGYDYA